MPLGKETRNELVTNAIASVYATYSNQIYIFQVRNVSY